MGTLALRYQHLHAPRLVPTETFDRTRLTPRAADPRLPSESFYASYRQRDPWFEDANLRALIGRTCPRSDQAFLKQLIDYGIAKAICAGARFSERRDSAAPALCESRTPSVLRP